MQSSCFKRFRSCGLSFQLLQQQLRLTEQGTQLPALIDRFAGVVAMLESVGIAPWGA
jgi:hypothetical protein